ncbi:hypothetical protein [Caldisericum sp.]|uniref:hypothetical protein n=1 Tax=Caldisericum sp. TaxID=2499687 RepID=UPI003D0BC402
MANLTPYETTIRQILKDIPTPDNQGKFWDPTEISFALNLAQIIFCRYAIATKQFYFLNKLFYSITTSDSVYTIGSNNEPLILHPINAKVFNEENELTDARLYVGEGLQYINVGHNACFLVNNTLIFVRRNKQKGNSIPTGGQFNYYREPSRIYLDSEVLKPVPPQPFEASFDEYVYSQYIVPYSIVILGMKEITNQRDYKYYKKFITEILNMPSNFANYVEDFEFTGLKVRPGRPPKQDIEQ